MLAFAYLFPLGLRELWLPDEARYAEISREMLASGDWIAPRLLGLRYFEKPVGGYWLDNLSLSLWGHNAFGVRFPSAFAAFATALLVALMMRSGTGDARKATLAALVYLSTGAVFALGNHAVLDSMLCMWLTAALGAFWCAARATTSRRRVLWWTLAGAACGAAFLTKGFVALAVPVVAVTPFLLWQKRGSELLRYGPVAIAAAVAVALPWSLAVHAREPDFWRWFFFVEHVQRFAHEDAQHRQPFWYYVPLLLGMALPWSLALPGALRDAWRGARAGVAILRFGLCALIMPLLLLSCANGKMATYLLPCFPPLALLLGSAIEEWLAAGRIGTLRVATRIVAGVMACGVTAVGVALVLFGDQEMIAGEHLRLGILACGGIAWIAIAAVALRRRTGDACLAALSLLPLCFGTVLPFALPRSIASAKAPGELVRAYGRSLAQGTVLVSTSVALSYSVAWELQRADVYLIGETGELTYGTSAPGAQERRIDETEFSSWLASVRAQHPVALFVRVDEEHELTRYPPPERVMQSGKLAMLCYEKVPR